MKKVLFYFVYVLLLILGTVTINSFNKVEKANAFDSSKCKEIYGGSCIDKNGTPRCLSPYTESCGDNCSREVTCGSNGEFRGGACKCSAPNAPQCPVATIWNGSFCEGTAKGTKYETRDQAPVQNGGEKVADNGQHGGREISRAFANTLIASGGGRGGSSGGGGRGGSSGGGGRGGSSGAAGNSRATFDPTRPIDNIDVSNCSDVLRSHTTITTIPRGSKCQIKITQAGSTFLIETKDLTSINNRNNLSRLIKNLQSSDNVLVLSALTSLINVQCNSTGLTNRIDSNSNFVSYCHAPGILHILPAVNLEGRTCNANQQEFKSTNNVLVCETANDGQLKWIRKPQAKRDTAPGDPGINPPSYPLITSFISNAYAQSAPPTPELLNINDLKVGEYILTIPGFETANVTVVDENVKLEFYIDNNANGVKDEDEPLVDISQVLIPISKVSTIEKYDLVAGWNLINIPVFDSSIQKASELITNSLLFEGFVTQVSKFDNGNWIHYTQSVTEGGELLTFGVDFNLVPGESYFVYSLNPSTFYIKGNDFLKTPPINMRKGWNLIGVSGPITLNAKQFLERCMSFLSGCTTISEWVNVGYNSLVFEDGEYYGEIFEINRKTGYFVLNKSEPLILQL
jgi:hypothetical protein